MLSYNTRAVPLFPKKTQLLLYYSKKINSVIVTSMFRILWIHSQNLGNIELMEKNIWLLRNRRFHVGGAFFTYTVNNLHFEMLILFHLRLQICYKLI